MTKPGKSKANNAADVAKHLAEQLERDGTLYQDCAVDEIMNNFGEEFVYENENGNPAISKEVLAEFRKLTPDAVWEKGERCWRFREDADSEGRAQE